MRWGSVGRISLTTTRAPPAPSVRTVQSHAADHSRRCSLVSALDPPAPVDDRGDVRARRDEDDVGVEAAHEIGVDPAPPGRALRAGAADVARVGLAVDRDVGRGAAAARRADDREVVALGEDLERRDPLLGVRVADDRDRQPAAPALHARDGCAPDPASRGRSTGRRRAARDRAPRRARGPSNPPGGRRNGTRQRAERRSTPRARRARRGARARGPRRGSGSAAPTGGRRRARTPSSRRRAPACSPRNGRSRRSASSGRKTIVGQCQRYSEYDRRPIAAGSRAADEPPQRMAAHEVQRGDEHDARDGHGEPREARVVLRADDLVPEQAERAERGDAQRGAGRAHARRSRPARRAGATAGAARRSRARRRRAAGRRGCACRSTSARPARAAATARARSR